MRCEQEVLCINEWHGCLNCVGLMFRGGNSFVFLGMNRASGEWVAIKRGVRSALSPEYKFLTRFRHPNSVEALRYYPYQGNHDYLILEL